MHMRRAPFDYSDPAYQLSSGQLADVDALRAMPAWRRRSCIRKWGAGSHVLIYKYLGFDPTDSFSLKKARDFIVESLLYLASPEDFNDPYDFRANVQLTKDEAVLEEWLHTSVRALLYRQPGLLPEIGRFRDKLAYLVNRSRQNLSKNSNLLNETFERARDLNGVACFTRDARNHLMWAHYASSHTGISLQFDISEDVGVLGLTQSVRYGHSFPSVEWPQGRTRIVDDVIRYKGHAWSSEQEVRYVSLSRVRDSIRFDPRALRAVVLGARFRKENEAHLLSLLTERRESGLPPLKVYRASTDPRSYRIAIKKYALLD